MFKFVVLVIGVCFAFRDQSIAITGTLKCSIKPLAGVKVDLLEKRKAPFSNQLLCSNVTDANGVFVLSGSTSRLLPVTPLLKVYQDCSKKSVTMKLNIIKNKVEREKTPSRVVNIGVINLDTWNRNATACSVSPQKSTDSECSIDVVQT